MFNELEGNEFSEVNRAMVTIRECGAPPPSTSVTVAFTAAMHSKGVLPAGNAVPCPPAPSCSAAWCSLFYLNPFSVKLFVTDLPFIEPLILFVCFCFPKLEYKGSCFVDRYGNMPTASPLSSISTLKQIPNS